MFRHHGRTRTLSHNLQIASLLSFVAGIVNIAGFLSVRRLTTNVTGHFAHFVDEMLRHNLLEITIFFFFIFFFFLGSFISSILIEIMHRRNERSIFIIPIMIECVILLSIASFGSYLKLHHPNFIAFGMLFSMGLQNSLVTRISGALVRTTHLTGLFTDLGIEISLLFFHKKDSEQKKLKAGIHLHLRIILFFFMGGIAGGIMYQKLDLLVLLIPVVALIVGLFYDYTKFRLIVMRRKYENRKK